VFVQVNVHEAKSQLSRLLELVEEGETVVIARNGQPVAELVAARKAPGFPFGIATAEPLVPPGDEWWQPVTDQEADDWIEGR
jgi:prevent-host-death family protein